jgi:TPR repeat protein
MYQYGFGVERDEDEAAEWYQKAAEQGNRDAQKALNNPNRF